MSDDLRKAAVRIISYDTQHCQFKLQEKGRRTNSLATNVTTVCGAMRIKWAVVPL